LKEIVKLMRPCPLQLYTILLIFILNKETYLINNKKWIKIILL